MEDLNNMNRQEKVELLGMMAGFVILSVIVFVVMIKVLPALIMMAV